MTHKKTTDYFIDISGRDKAEKPKAHVSLIYSLRYNNGTSIERQELTIPQKPVVSIFKHAGYVNVYLDFLSRDDSDLAMAWKLLSEYSNPENSVDWTEEELESGSYLGEDDKEHMIYFPMIELILSPIGRETEYMMHGLNPAFFTLQPNSPKESPCVIQLTFPEDWFIIDDNIEPVDMNAIRNELEEELGANPTELEG